jgi:predicted methyltransferase
MLCEKICAKLISAILSVCAALGCCSLPGPAAAAAAAPAPADAAIVVPAVVTSAIADPARPPEQVARDTERHPGEVLAFAGIRRGDRVADFMSGGAYFTRLFSPIVGNGGRVYAFLPDEQLKNCAPAETAGTRAIADDAHYHNVTVLQAPVNHFSAPEPLDLIWTSLNFHDLYDSFMGPADVPQVVDAFFEALKPGGVLLIVDHVAQPGSNVRDTESLHRIDPEAIIRTVTAAGFVLEAESNVLRNAADHHELKAFDPAIRGRTDQVVLKFRKPLRAAPLQPLS